jgi:hypothetical protein
MIQLFIKIAVLMFGGQWQSSIASELGIGERTVRRFVAGTSPIPMGVWTDLRLRLFNKGVEVHRMHERLTGLLPHTGKITLTPIPNTRPDVEIDGLYFWLNRPDGKMIRCRASRGIFGDLGADRPNEALPIFEKCSESFYRAASTKFALAEYDDRIGILLEPDDVIVLANR